MTEPSGIYWARDVYRAVFYPIGTDGGISVPPYPAPAADGYGGMEFKGPKRIAHSPGGRQRIVDLMRPKPLMPSRICARPSLEPCRISFPRGCRPSPAGP